VLTNNLDRSFVIPSTILDEKEDGIEKMYKKIKKIRHPSVFTFLPWKKKPKSYQCREGITQGQR